jgi:hypothetical protein
MTSDKQRDANIANAQRSSGPKTAAGKAKASANSLKHGMWAARAVLPDEDAEAFETLREGMFEQFQPAFPLEVELVEEVSTVLWRLRRIPQFEAGLYLMQHQEEEIDAAKQAIRDADPERVVLDAIQGTASPELMAVQQRLRTARASAQDGLMMSAAGFLRDAVSYNAVEKIGRHETRLQNRLTRLLRALADLQAGRVEEATIVGDETG